MQQNSGVAILRVFTMQKQQVDRKKLYKENAKRTETVLGWIWEEGKAWQPFLHPLITCLEGPTSTRVYLDKQQVNTAANVTQNTAEANKKSTSVAMW
jgi:hypothetical protein